MVEIGKRYKLKKIKAPFLQNDESDYEVLDIYGRMVACQNVDTGERFTFVDDMFVTDPNEDVYGELKPVVECGAAAACCPAATAGGGGATGAAPCPALGHVQGTMVNGVPVEGKSVKKKKKKSKKNEASFSGIVVEQEDIDNFDIQEVKHYFQQNIQQKEIKVKVLQDVVKIVGKTWSETQSHLGKVPFFLLFKQLDSILETSTGTGKLVSNTKPRKDNVKGWYYLYNNVLFGQNLLKIKLDVAEFNDNKKIYFLRSTKEETTSSSPSNECCHVGRNVISTFIIPENEQKDNLYGFQYNKEYDLTPYFHFTILNKELNEDLQELSVSELIEEVQETFAPNDVLTTTIEDNRQKLIISVYYTNPEDRVLTHSVKIEYLDPITDVKLDEEITDDLTIQEVVDIINYVAYNHLTESINEDAEDVIDDIVDVLDTEMERVSNFKEKYEEIADLLSKQLDRMNFEFANTEDIIYKKEGSHKYLLKFDNENGVLKFKVNKDDDTIFDKEWKLEEGEDISPIFTEIENIYKQYGI